LDIITGGVNMLIWRAWHGK